MRMSSVARTINLYDDLSQPRATSLSSYRQNIAKRGNIVINQNDDIDADAAVDAGVDIVVPSAAKSNNHNNTNNNNNNNNNSRYKSKTQQAADKRADQEKRVTSEISSTPTHEDTD
jgi:hypothetical protein